MTSMGCHEVTGDGEAEAGTVRSRAADEAVEHLREQLGGDAGAVVHDGHPDEIAGGRRPDADAASGRSVPDGIREEVAQDHPDASWIHVDRWHSVFDLLAQPDAPGFGGGLVDGLTELAGQLPALTA